PAVVALTMLDVAESRGISVDVAALSQQLSVPVIPVNAPEGRGINELKQALLLATQQKGAALGVPFPDDLARGVNTLHNELTGLAVKLGYTPTRPETLRLLVDGTGPFFDECEAAGGEAFVKRFHEIREAAAA